MVDPSFTQPMQAWPELAKYEHRAKLPGSQLEIFLFKAGLPTLPTLLLVHGLGDEADTWRHIFPQLTQSWQVIALDLPGFGRSDKPKVNYTLAFYRKSLLELLDVLEIERATLVGHSLGATVSQSLALEHPERLERLILVSGGLVLRKQPLNLATILFLIPGLGEWLYNRLRRDPQKAFETLNPYYANLAGFPAEERQFLFQRVNQRVWSDAQRDAFLSTLRNLGQSISANRQALEEKIRQTNIPTTLIWGEADRMVDPRNGRYLAELIPGARLVLAPGAGHNLQQEQPGIILDALRISESSINPSIGLVENPTLH